MESTLNIKHTKSTIKDFGPEKPLIDSLLQFVDFQKSLADEKVYSELTQLINDFEIIQIIGENTTKQIMNEINCKICGKPRQKRLSCRCFLCYHQIDELINSIRRLFSNENFENFQDLVNLVTCPKCSRKIIESDLEELIPNVHEAVQTCLRNSIIRNVRTSEKFRCLNCKKVRGKFLLPDEKALSCLHMCLFCIFEGYSKNKSKTCALCSDQIQMNFLFPIKITCFDCNHVFFFGGDRMIEIDPGVILCPNCCLTKLRNRYSDHSNRNMEIGEIMGYYFYLFKVCWQCKAEVFIEELSQKRCCFNYFCIRCLSNSVNRCPKCDGSDL